MQLSHVTTVTSRPRPGFEIQQQNKMWRQTTAFGWTVTSTLIQLLWIVWCASGIFTAHMFFLQFCCKGGNIFAFLTNITMTSSNDNHLKCDMPQYIYLSAVVSFICVSVFLKLSSCIRLALMLIMAAFYLVLMEFTHKIVFDNFDGKGTNSGNSLGASETIRR